jgi:hypothetical protein
MRQEKTLRVNVACNFALEMDVDGGAEEFAASERFLKDCCLRFDAGAEGLSLVMRSEANCLLRFNFLLSCFVSAPIPSSVSLSSK